MIHLLRHAGTSKLTIFYHAAVIESIGTPFALQALRLQRCGGERHENLSTDVVNRNTFDRDSFHFTA
jgi:hypothetical protein